MNVAALNNPTGALRSVSEQVESRSERLRQHRHQNESCSHHAPAVEEFVPPLIHPAHRSGAVRNDVTAVVEVLWCLAGAVRLTLAVHGG